MTDNPRAGRKPPSAATIALGAAALIAIVSAGIALSRADRPPPVPAATASAQPVASVADKIAGIEARLRGNPDNPADWRLLGWSLFETGNLAGSADAYRRAAELEPGKAENWSSLGEALQDASTEVSPEAAAAFARALKLDAKDPRARYFLAVQEDLKGRHQAAVNGWIALLRDTPPGAPWEADLRRTIAQVAGKHGIDIAGRIPAASSVATDAIPGPTPEQLAAASSIPPDRQDAMVRSMVDRLAARLKTSPRDAIGWIQLMRARMVLGQTKEASDALGAARAAFRDDAAARAQLDDAARQLGMPVGG